ncbi:MAG: hypothetical protein C0467_12095 [Planctomycetaceae bacterium]|nr:hypothetical protein [Planctomycetaceae bacterium]
MSGDILNLQITIISPNGDITASVTPRATERVADLMAHLILEYRLAGLPENWQLLLNGRPLSLEALLRDELPAEQGTISLTLSPTGATMPQGIPGMPPAPTSRTPGRSSGGFSGSVARPSAPQELPRPAPMAPGAPQPAPMAAPAPARSAPSSERYYRESRARSSARVAVPETTERRATVRYYSRMNPDRVFPLLVILTRDEVEKVIKKHVEQTATGPLTLAKDVPLEVEPVLPGCQCHPPKIVTRLGDGNDVFTFYIVPHVLGDITGARVLIRQDHATIAEIELKMRVVQRTLVVASGLSTFVVPAASAAMKHFGLDFTPKDGSSPYLAALNFLFGQVSPVVLTAVLAVVTVGLYWFTRPKGRDVFFDISTKPPK